jgi:hypothetical protein
MATLRIRYHQNVGPNQVQAPQSKISDETALTIAGEAHTTAVAQACLAELSCDAICAVDYGPAASANAANSQRLPANVYGYFLWLNKGDFISVITTT